MPEPVRLGLLGNYQVVRSIWTFLDLSFDSACQSLHVKQTCLEHRFYSLHLLVLMYVSNSLMYELEVSNLTLTATLPGCKSL